MKLNAETDMEAIEECYLLSGSPQLIQFAFLYIPELSALECPHPLWAGAFYIISVIKKVPPHTWLQVKLMEAFSLLWFAFLI